ncbi:DoxX family protein [Bradyrhizobium sp.]|jgi:putative oxidoreductase|uniref:DoxX family protein n=1 Tax=Bradyrhizobium sp. TaxID=376 RepID=UPI001D261F64|nr:DoxX family protein [Bradyrhizobium sp.]MBI5321837.1 DoxX family protein [Bradyrhizobium sp.]
MIDARTAPFAALVLRLTLGAMFLAHAGLKIFVFTPAGFVKNFGGLGLPAWLAYFIIAIEIVGGLALILGVLARWAALILSAELVVTIVMVHGARGFLFTNPGGGWEFPALWAASALALALLGDGAYALIRSWPDRANPALRS